MQPIIGIAGNHLLHPNSDFVTDYVDYVQSNYIRAIRAADGIPMVLPVGQPETATAYLSRIDGLLLTGGSDVDPRFYGEDPDPKLGAVDLPRDHFELALIEAARAQQKPIFGICRGAQMLVVANGGSLYQDMSDYQVQQPIQHNQAPTDWSIATHEVAFKSGSFLSSIFGEYYYTNSFHHQGIKTLGPDFNSLAHTRDQLTEAFESTNGLIFGVQFHPEMLFETDTRFRSVFDHLITLAKK